jgi:hypothetical protein
MGCHSPRSLVETSIRNIEAAESFPLAWILVEWLAKLRLARSSESVLPW